MIKSLKYQAKDVYLTLSSIFYRGHNFHCPICQKFFRKMKPHKGIYSLQGTTIDHYPPDAHCPSCNLDIRHRLFYKNFIPYLHGNNYSVLHFAPEYRIYTILKTYSLTKYTVADIDPDLYSTAQQIDATKIPYETNTFDFIIFNHILQFIADDTKALSELHRALKVRGKLFLTVPIYGDSTFDGVQLSVNERTRIMGAPDHLRMYGLDLVTRLENLNMSVKVIDLYATKSNIYNEKFKSPHSDSDRYLFICEKN